MEQTIYKHTIFININNRVVRHIVDDMVLNKDEINPINTDQQYTVYF